jgi:hypothetical protein
MPMARRVVEGLPTLRRTRKYRVVKSRQKRTIQGSVGLTAVYDLDGWDAARQAFVTPVGRPTATVNCDYNTR